MEFKRIHNPTSRTSTRTVANKKRGTRRRKKNTATSAPRKANTAIVRATSASVANKRRRRKRSNPATPKTVANKRRSRRSMRKRNGIFGNSKETFQKVASLGAGVVGTKMLAPFVGKLLNQFWVMLNFPAGWAMVANEGATSLALLFGGKMIGKNVGLPNLGSDLFIGGLVVTAIDGADAVVPNSPFNIFSNNSAVYTQGVITGAQAAVKDIASGEPLANVMSKLGMLPRRNRAVQQSGQQRINLNASL